MRPVTTIGVPGNHDRRMVHVDEPNPDSPEQGRNCVPTEVDGEQHMPVMGGGGDRQGDPRARQTKGLRRSGPLVACGRKV
jgi:hypothetical protein